jgi:predicted ester cyclase
VSSSRQWDHFSNYLDSLIEQKHKVLEQSNDMVAVHKAQGAIEAFRKVRRLREEVSDVDG